MVSCRLVGRAEDRIDTILLEPARQWGLEAAGRYSRLILAALTALGGSPGRLGSHAVPRHSSVRTYQLDAARRLVAAEHRVRAGDF